MKNFFDDFRMLSKFVGSFILVLALMVSISSEVFAERKNNDNSTPNPDKGHGKYRNIDSDGDGVSDAFDLCPETLPGTSVDSNGCPLPDPPSSTLDSDGDGVEDSTDQCPGTPAGVSVDLTGCPVIDPPTQGDEHHGTDCVSCHTTEANEVHASLHYQWQGDAPYMVNGGSPQGKLTNSVNSYCISILGNWQGCSACHIGKGAIPEPVATQEQLENIDCLKCHSKGGVLPTRAECLTCHAKAGGGDAVKRGDLALATTATTDSLYDIHMSTSGADLQCQNCHMTQNHRIAGKGSDLRPTDLNVQVDCANCHGNNPHSESTLDQHTSRVACQACHIPVYGKDAFDTLANEATETFRTWKFSHADAPPFHPASEKANNLIPRYRFWNGLSDNYLLGDIAELDAQTGAYPTSRPVGSVQDGKLYPFKYKTAEQPMTSGSNQLIALDTSIYFATANPDAAIVQGLMNMGMSESTPWEWVLTDTFQALNHQVSPKSQALQCSSCHGTTTRIDLQGELGYRLKAPQSSVCTQCHRNKELKPFQSLHDRHVKDKSYDCSWCHTFSRPERGLRLP